MADTEHRHDGWRCFHCDEQFPDTEEGRRTAADHFGVDHPGNEPACIMKLNGGDRYFLRECAKLHSELMRCYDEDSDVMRILAKKTGRHSEELIQAEEAGYARGLAAAPELWRSPSALHGMRVIWSYEHGAYWRAKSAGYCAELFGAGLYSSEEAEDICRGANSGGDRQEAHFDAEERWKRLIGDISPSCLLSAVVCSSAPASAASPIPPQGEKT